MRHTLLCGTVLIATSFTTLLTPRPASAELDEGVPTLAAPVDFQGVLIDADTVALRWNETLLDGSRPTAFTVYNQGFPLATVTSGSWEYSGIDRNLSYDFSVSATLPSGEESRKSNRVYFDLPQLDASTPDGDDDDLPPLENFQATIIDESTVELSWDAPRDFWSWVDPADYEFEIYIQQSRVAVTSALSYRLEGLSAAEGRWVAVSSRATCCSLYSNMLNFVYVDTRRMPAGTLVQGYPGFSVVDSLRTAIYSSTAAEVFWKHNQFPTTTNIYVNGRLVTREPDVLSVYLDNLPAGEELLISVGDGWPYEYPEGDNGHDSLLISATIDLPGEPADGAGDLTGITGLRSDVYSSTAAEVFWDRHTTPRMRYEVQLNDSTPIETSGTSLFLDDLEPGTTHTVSVRALNIEGDPTLPEEVSFSTPSANGYSPTTCIVENLRSVVYSSTAAEIFWSRDPAGPSYSLELDGLPIKSTQGTSWFIDNLEPGSMHSVSVSVSDSECADATLSSTEFVLHGAY